MLASEAIPTDWTRFLRGGKLTLGYDVATTENKTSNPSSFTVSEEVGHRFYERLVVRFRSFDPDAAMVALESVLKAPQQQMWKGMGVDASNEKYHAQNVRKRFRSILPVTLISSGETLVWQRDKFTYKTLLGDLYISSYQDGAIACPDEKFILDDRRLVKNHAGSYVTDTDDEGNHGDTFDSGKLAHWIHLCGIGPVRADALQVGNFSTGSGGSKHRGGLGPRIPGQSTRIRNQGGQLA
ncbi:MAG: hypothetical protein QM680_14550 [Luteolibacter sp.]